ncbi:MAG TPA: SIMPL domain-containing protein [Methanothrix sp.]|nr:SIMPL domain-containing protein [Methanothrix sp.]
MKWLVIIFSVMITAILPAVALGTNPTLTIVGEGTVTVPADTATISVSVESGIENMTEAQASVQEKMDLVIDALKTAGVKDEEILPGQSSGVSSFQSTSKVCKRVNNSTVCENNTQQASSLERSTVIRLRSTDESRINQVLDVARSAGAQAYVAGYGLSDASKAAAEARQKAVANAKENAAGMAAAEGVRLGKVVDISDYGYPVALTDYYSSLAPLGMVDVTSYVIVTYEFEI